MATARAVRLADRNLVTSAAPCPADPGLFIYSDGLSEARDESGEDFGAQRVVKLAEVHRGSSPEEIVAACLRDLRAFRGAAPASDDLTLLALQRQR